jgi:hypothetical protein
VTTQLQLINIIIIIIILGTHLYGKKEHKSHATPLLLNPARKEGKIKTVDVSFFLMSSEPRPGLFSKIKSDLIDIFQFYV